MNQIFAAGTALILAGVLWGLGKRPKSIGKLSIEETFPITPRSLSFKKNSVKLFKKTLVEKSEKAWIPPTNLKEKIEMLRYLEGLMVLAPEERLKAMQIAANWGDKSVLPILKLGLRDSDSDIVVIAAQAMEKFRCHSQAVKSDHIERPPLNVFLMR